MPAALEGKGASSYPLRQCFDAIRRQQHVAAGLVGIEREEARVELGEARAVADREDRGLRQPLHEQPVQRALGLLVETAGRFVEEQPVRPLEERAGEADALLLAAGEWARLLVLLVEPQDEMVADGAHRRRHFLV